MKKVRPFIAAALSFLLGFVLFRFSGFSLPYPELLFLPAFGGLFVLIQKSLALPFDKQRAIFSLLFGIALAASFVIGRKIHLWQEPYYEAFRVSDLLYGAALSLIFFCAARLLLATAEKRSLPLRSVSRKKGSWLWISLILFLAWIPYFLIYYPGIVSIDSYESLTQCLGLHVYYNHHPLLFTLLIRICMTPGLWLGNMNVAVAGFTLVQMAIFALMLGYSVGWLREKGAPRAAVWITGGFFALNPVIAIYSITMWKDVLFAGWILLLVLFLWDAAQSRGACLRGIKGVGKLVFLSLGVVFSRNNGRYVLILVFLALLIAFRKEWKRLLAVSLSVLIGVFAVQGPLYSALGVQKGNFAESVGVPLQQIAFSLKENGQVTEEQKEFLDQIMPTEQMVALYNPATCDDIKFDHAFQNEFLNTHKAEFLKVWLEMLPANFASYVKAWLMNTLGYYHIGTGNWVVFLGMQKNEIGLERHDLVREATGLDLNPVVTRGVDVLWHLPVIENLFSMAFLFWAAVLAALALIRQKRARFLPALIPLLGVWATLMIATPIYCEFRYMLSFHLAAPFLFLFPFLREKEN